MVKNRHKCRVPKRGFTLLEVLTASVILAGAVAWLCAMNTRCLTQTRKNQQYKQGFAVLDRQLAAIELMGIDAFVDQGITKGQTEQFGRDYYWNAKMTLGELDNLYLVAMSVSWADGKKVRQVKAETEFNGAPMSLIGQ